MCGRRKRCSPIVGGILAAKKTSMHICFISHLANMEGSERSLLGIIDYLMPMGVDISVVLPRRGPLVDELDRRQIAYRLTRLPWWTTRPGETTNPDRMLRRIVETGAVVAKMVEAWHADVVYTNTSVISAGALAAMLTGKPHVWHIREVPSNPEGIRYLLPLSTMVRFMDLSSNMVLYNSEAVRREWAGQTPLEKTRVINNYLPAPVVGEAEGVLELFERRPGLKEKFKIAIVGSILEWKRQLDAVRAITTLIKSAKPVCLLIVGPVSNEAYFEKIKALIREENMEDSVLYLGYLDNPAQVMGAADLTLVCSKTEPFGRVTIESMLVGTPVIGACGGGTPELINDGVDGLLYAPGNVDDLAEKINSMVEDRPRLAKMGDAARLSAKRFSSIAHTIGPIHDILRSLQGQENPAQALGAVLSGSLSDMANQRSVGGWGGVDRLRRLMAGMFRRIRGTQ